MPSGPLRVDAATTLVLHDAHYKISNYFAPQPGGQHYELYDFIRATMRKLAPFDAFYIGLLDGSDRVRFAYGWDSGKFDSPVTHTVGPDSPSAWIVKHRTTYRFAYDNGAMLRTGISFGDVLRESADVVTVPLFRSEGADRGPVFGMLSMHSYTSNAFNDNAVRAFEWLADRVARALTRKTEDDEALRLLPGGEDAAPPTLTSSHVAEYLTARIAGIQELAEKAMTERGIERGTERGTTAHDNTRRDTVDSCLERIVAECERTRSEVVEMGLHTDRGPEERFRKLTEAEERVVLALVNGLSDQRIAAELGSSIDTVKTHMRRIRQKYGMSSRAQIADDVRRYLAR
ncbi:LuxR C-terminal-related transcriptional regulator [Streptomyces sp. NPDC093109]|uniref:LuxR C-terminal-related transcriptional regulator n=1 Tax=Streptomyces sp. NPDC093109 TaxID=3154977 RepID=UPI0034508F85